ncbi:MAG: DUF4190 domain-containing protein [Phycisphaerales bacterium]|nr:DUF4190 domain-containing protein [Phycisphaerales bacterium]
MEQPIPEQPRTSKLAIASLVMTVLSCCSVCGVVPIVLSIVSIIRIKLNPALRGMGVAVTALILNLALTAASSVWLLPQAKQVFEQVFGMILKGPADAISAGQSGDVEAFLTATYRGGPDAPGTEDAAVFLDALTERFGQIQSSVIQDQNRGAPQPGATDAPIEYLLTFTKDGKTSAIKCEVLWSMANAAGDLDVKIRRIRVFADDMEIVFPPQSGPLGDGGGEDDDDGKGDDAGSAGGSAP